MAKKSNVTKFKKRRTINIGHIVFLIIFIYIAISIFIYFTKDHLTIYEVRTGSIAKETVYNGVILRDEEVFNTDREGYIYYYYKDKERIPGNSVVYSINENENPTSLVTGELDSSNLSNNEVAVINKEISSFRDVYSDSNFTSVYNLKYNLNRASLEIMNEQNQNYLKDFANSNAGNNFQIVNSNKSGVITYYVDNFETISENEITHEHFKQENYQKTLLRKDEKNEVGSPAYKLVTDNTWDIIIPLNEESYNYLSEQEAANIQDVTIKFVDEDLECPGRFTYYKNGDEYFGKITLEYYMEKFIDKRYVDIEVMLDEKIGLKIPTSAIVDKEFYLIPNDYFTMGGDSKENGLILETYNEENELVLTFVPTEIFYQDETSSYVDTNSFEANSWIRTESGERLKLSETASLKGVYNVNKGYGVFRRIEIIEEGEEYTIVKPETSYGLSVYDQIALLGDTAIEEQIIY